MMNVLARIREEGDFEQVNLRSGERSSPEALPAIGEKTRTLLERSREAGVPPEVLLENETPARLGAARGWRRWFV